MPRTNSYSMLCIGCDTAACWKVSNIVRCARSRLPFATVSSGVGPGRSRNGKEGKKISDRQDDVVKIPRNCVSPLPLALSLAPTRVLAFSLSVARISARGRRIGLPCCVSPFVEISVVECHGVSAEPRACPINKIYLCSDLAGSRRSC